MSAGTADQRPTRDRRGPRTEPRAAPGSDPAHDTPRAAAVRQLARQRAAERGPLVEILHDVQRELGHIDPADVPVIAHVLNLSVADVHGVVSFYHDFRTSPGARHTVRICRAEACQAVGAQALYDGARQSLSARQDVALEQAFCFGNCALGPTVMVDGRLHGRVDAATLDRLTSLTTLGAV